MECSDDGGCAMCAEGWRLEDGQCQGETPIVIDFKDFLIKNYPCLSNRLLITVKPVLSNPAAESTILKCNVNGLIGNDLQ